MNYTVKRGFNEHDNDDEICYSVLSKNTQSTQNKLDTVRACACAGILY